MPLMHDKPTLRQHMRGRLRAMEESTRRSAAAHIAAHILRRCDQADAPFAISLFGGLPNEPDFLPLVLPAIVAAASCAAFFQIEGNELRPRQVRSMDDLQRGAMNVWEPKAHCPSVPVSSLDIILVPGLAFTRGGLRLGRGGGFYDRLLAHPDFRARRIGIAYDLQIIDDIPCEPHDQRVHQIITETGLIDASPNG